MSEMTREQVERECQWLVEEHCQSAARKLDAHDALQRQRIAELEARVKQLESINFDYQLGAQAMEEHIGKLEAEVNAMRTASQLTHFILEHPDGDYDKPEQIQAEAEQYGLEKLFALKAEVARLKAQLPEGMEHCTILFKECAKGHGRLTAANWVPHECHWCEIEKLQAEVARLSRDLDWWNIARGPDLEAEVTRLKGRLLEFTGDEDGHIV